MAQTWETRQTYDIDVILCVFFDTRRGLPIDWKPPDFFPFLLCRAKSNRVSLSSSPSSPPDPSSSEMQLSSSTSRSSNFILANVFSMLTALHVVHEGSEFVMHNLKPSQPEVLSTGSLYSHGKGRVQTKTSILGLICGGNGDAEKGGRRKGKWWRYAGGENLRPDRRAKEKTWEPRSLGLNCCACCVRIYFTVWVGKGRFVRLEMFF